ncbi:cell envelope integrity protein TolA [Ruthenibacterium lactatiformans]|uniref:cell envelope integrity protein TolA n=1 Tax=Ruthenibacterium lactatiformans TaxID=1550024 RepID=UPI001966EC01|nr:cell envelope integrity protein TolA [Ruthenibacterium lactatiformans]MBN3013992.1 hypothetical protein [Ruthenibacterium lactatiformans]
MNRYLCKCGRAVNKSTNADNTGNRETEGCEGCPYLMPWGPTEWDHTRHAMVTDVKGYECRMSPTLEYRTELRGHLDDKTTIRITSLDFDFLERVSDWVKEHYPNGELYGGFSRDRIRAVEYVDEGRYRYTLACSQNKKGIAAKRALWAEFFDETFHRKDMDADAEKQKILRDIAQGKAAAHKDAAATDKETNTMLIYRDPATGWLYRVSPQPEHGSYVMQYRDPANSATWKWCANWNIGNIYRESLEEVLEARAKRDGWELVSSSASSEPPEVVDKGEEYSPCDTCRCPDCIDSSCPQAGCDKTDGGFGCFAPYEECPAPAEETCPDERLEKEVGKCKNQSAPNGDAAATTAGSAVPEPAETSTTPTDANTLPAPDCPADAGSATQSLSAAGPASLEAEPEATPFDYSGLDAQTVATLHSAENIIRSARKEYVIKVADAVGMAHDELVRNSDGHNQYSEDTFIAWCKFVGISKSTAYQLLQVSNLLESSTPNEQKILKQASPSLLYAAARPSAEPEAVAALKGGDISTHKQYKELEAQLKAEREAREKAEHETELERKEREDAHAAALRYKAEADRRAQDQNRLEGLVQTVTHERDGARQALAAAKLRGDKLKEENDALREQPIRGDFADADEIDRRAQEKAEAMTAEYRDQIAELQDRAETGDANACYDQVILASRALENAWTLAKSAYKRLPAGMRAYPREMLHNAFAKFEEELKCL